MFFWKGALFLLILHSFILGWYSFIAMLLQKKYKSQANNILIFSLEKKPVQCSKKTRAQKNIFNWYNQWAGKIKINNLQAKKNQKKDVKKNKQETIYMNPWNLFLGIKNNTSFLCWFLKLNFFVLWSLVKKNWWYGVMFAEIVKAKAVSLAPTEALPREILFPWLGQYYRPLWTYVAERKSCQITLFFPSISETPTIPNVSNDRKYEWGGGSWPRILVWDKYSKKRLNSCFQCKDKIETVGPIWFSDSNESLPFIPSRSIAVFNIEPHRISVHQPESTYADWYALFPNITAMFLDNIQSVLESKQFKMVWKYKREISKRADPRIKSLYQKISQKNNVISVLPGIAAERVIEKCKAVISSPFTSTAVIGKSQGIPSVFYDPTQYLRKTDPARHGIPIISGKKSFAIL